MDFDFDMPRFEDDGVILPEAEPFPAMAAGDPRNPGNVFSSSQGQRDQESSESAEAPLQRRPLRPRVLPMDERQELRNADLASWKEDYLTNMFEATQTRQQRQAPFIAKKNAAFFVIGGGIGGVGTGIGRSKLTGPLDMFAGDAMMEMLTGTEHSAGRKRSRDSEDREDSDSEARRIRLREDDGEQVGRGDGMMPPDDDTMMIPGSEVRDSFIFPASLGSIALFKQALIVACARPSKWAATLLPPSRTAQRIPGTPPPQL